MSWQTVLRQPLFQYSLEIALPVIGYLFFGWSIAVIIAFYFFDYFGSEIARHRRHKKVLEVNAPKATKQFKAAIAYSTVCFLSTLLLGYFVLLNLELNQEYDYQAVDEVMKFIQDEGWFLLPIVVLAAVMKDKMAYYLPKKYLSYSFTKLIKCFYLETSILLIVLSAGLYAYHIIALKEMNALLMLSIFILCKLAFDLLLVKKLDEKAKL